MKIYSKLNLLLVVAATGQYTGNDNEGSGHEIGSPEEEQSGHGAIDESPSESEYVSVYYDNEELGQYQYQMQNDYVPIEPENVEVVEDVEETNYRQTNDKAAEPKRKQQQRETAQKPQQPQQKQQAEIAKPSHENIEILDALQFSNPSQNNQNGANQDVESLTEAERLQQEDQRIANEVQRLANEREQQVINMLQRQNAHDLLKKIEAERHAAEQAKIELDQEQASTARLAADATHRFMEQARERLMEQKQAEVEGIQRMAAPDNFTDQVAKHRAIADQARIQADRTRNTQLQVQLEMAQIQQQQLTDQMKHAEIGVDIDADTEK